MARPTMPRWGMPAGLRRRGRRQRTDGEDVAPALDARRARTISRSSGNMNSTPMPADSTTPEHAQAGRGAGVVEGVQAVLQQPGGGHRQQPDDSTASVSHTATVSPWSKLAPLEHGGDDHVAHHDEHRGGEGHVPGDAGHAVLQPQAEAPPGLGVVHLDLGQVGQLGRGHAHPEQADRQQVEHHRVGERRHRARDAGSWPATGRPSP